MLTMIERKLLAAIIHLSDEDGYVKNRSMKELAERMGYTSAGGAITLSLKTLEMRNYITVERKESKETRKSLIIRVLL